MADPSGMNVFAVERWTPLTIVYLFILWFPIFAAGFAPNHAFECGLHVGQAPGGTLYFWLICAECSNKTRML